MSSGESKDKKLKIAIVGGGLVGSLASLYLAKNGHDVHLFEYREDIRIAKFVQGRSINLALSERGRSALAGVGLEELVIKTAIPMRGRMLHDLYGSLTEVKYDTVKHQCLYSVGRKQLNEVLLNHTEKHNNITLHFNMKLLSAKFDDGTLVFKNTLTNVEEKHYADLILGCDGAFSAVRGAMIKHPGFNYSQEYIEHRYKELCIPPKNGEFAMPENFLHIWPRNEFMMIALPNQDKSFTVTLSMPYTHFDKIKTESDLIDFFERHYADAIPLIGREKLIENFFKSKPQHLVSIKCKPYHISSRVLLLGDAAHAMVPYYGQGMNAGFEDCAIFCRILGKGIPIADALAEFSRTRWEDAHAICDLAMYNYIEMRDLVTRRTFLARKVFDEFLYRMLPNTWMPLYNSVSFSNMPYRKCIENRKWQDQILRRVLTILGVAATVSGAFTLFYYKDTLLNQAISWRKYF